MDRERHGGPVTTIGSTTFLTQLSTLNPMGWGRVCQTKNKQTWSMGVLIHSSAYLPLSPLTSLEMTGWNIVVTLSDAEGSFYTEEGSCGVFCGCIMDFLASLSHCSPLHPMQNCSWASGDLSDQCLMQRGGHAFRKQTTPTPPTQTHWNYFCSRTGLYGSRP